MLGSCKRDLEGLITRSIAMGGRAGRSGRKPHLNEDGSRKHKKRERSVPRGEGQTTRKTQGRAVPQPASVAGASEHASDIATCLVNTAVQQSNDARIENERVDAEFEEDEDGNPRIVERLTMPPTASAQVEHEGQHQGCIPPTASANPKPTTPTPQPINSAVGGPTNACLSISSPSNVPLLWQ